MIPKTLQKNQRGFSLVEVVVSIFIASVVIFAITNLNIQTTKISLKNMTELRANLYAMEGIEVGKDLEITDWTKITGATCNSDTPVTSVCKPVMTPSTGGPWSLLPGGPETIDGIFTRSVWVESVYRDRCSPFPTYIQSSGSICLGLGGTPTTKKFVSKVTWNDSSGVRTQRLETYLYHFP